MTIELLAPAKNVKLGKLAINCGADAVYIGANFSARKAASNTIEDIVLLIDFAHRFQANVYVALNTILTDEEIPVAVDMLHTLHQQGIDGAIIQDFGLLSQKLPPIKLIASTQTQNESAKHIQFLKDIGFQRAILARELTAYQIHKIHTAVPNMELEAFVHGALCVCYSGRCYFSFAHGRRSANRGECAQPCRKKYKLINEKGELKKEGYLLSPKDLNRINTMESLLDAGVTSLKIEGRLKNESYLINTVCAYRKELDAILDKRTIARKKDLYTPTPITDLNKTFNRGYVEGFATKDEAMASLDTPKMKGERLGTVVSRTGNTIHLHNSSPIHPDDGLCFFANNELVGTKVLKVKNTHITLHDASKVSVGTTIYRNRDAHFHKQLHSNAPMRKVPISLFVTTIKNSIQLKATDGVGNSALIELEGPFSKAKDTKKNRATWEKQLKKTGESEFLCTHLSVSPSVFFAPKSVINKARRDCLQRLRKARIQSLKNDPTESNTSVNQYKTTPYTNIHNDAAFNFYKKLSDSTPKWGIEKQPPNTYTLMQSKYCIKRELNICNTKAAHETLYLVDSQQPNIKLKLHFDCHACAMDVLLEE